MAVGLQDVANEQYCLRVMLRYPTPGVDTNEQLLDQFLGAASGNGDQRSLRPVDHLCIASDLDHKSAWRFGETGEGQQARLRRQLDIVHAAYRVEQPIWEQVAGDIHGRNDTDLEAVLMGGGADAGLTLCHLLAYEADQLQRGQREVTAYIRIDSQGPLQGGLLEKVGHTDNRQLKELLNRVQALVEHRVAGAQHAAPPADGEDYDMVDEA